MRGDCSLLLLIVLELLKQRLRKKCGIETVIRNPRPLQWNPYQLKQYLWTFQEKRFKPEAFSNIRLPSSTTF
jgi:hypothetical protein